jgi:hypothetical protein
VKKRATYKEGQEAIIRTKTAVYGLATIVRKTDPGLVIKSPTKVEVCVLPDGSILAEPIRTTEILPWADIVSVQFLY